MTILVRTEWVLVLINRCPVCKKLHLAQTGPTTYTCAAVHPPGSCCHYGEKPITEDQADRLMAIVREQPEELR